MTLIPAVYFVLLIGPGLLLLLILDYCGNSVGSRTGTPARPLSPEQPLHFISHLLPPPRKHLGPVDFLVELRGKINLRTVDLEGYFCLLT